ncbi:hypothetical protein [uncultured Bacteroides sp.]|mgnify:CR=1 FL=1|uniref:hypothetical protein n=1 Tax=uncultured Bacteroides sp. TaxID=162156 RepID=UPI002732DCC0|nr:hypothetical protein [uncultured Bacteroides sp.]
MLKDGIVLEDSGNRVIVNQYSFCELIKHLLTHYVGISYEKASKIVAQSHLTKPISSVMDAGLLGHEYPYYWAMNLYYGAMYWERGIPTQPDDLTAYFELENSIMKRHNLNNPFEYIPFVK